MRAGGEQIEPPEMSPVDVYEQVGVARRSAHLRGYGTEDAYVRDSPVGSDLDDLVSALIRSRCWARAQDSPSYGEAKCPPGVAGVVRQRGGSAAVRRIQRMDTKLQVREVRIRVTTAHRKY